MCDEDVDDVDDVITHVMWDEWKNMLLKSNTADIERMKRDVAYQNLEKYMQHDKVGAVRMEILKGRKYRRFGRIEKKFDSLIFVVDNIPKGETYHFLMKVHNNSADIWGPLSNMVSIHVPQEFASVSAFSDNSMNLI